MKKRIMLLVFMMLGVLTVFRIAACSTTKPDNYGARPTYKVGYPVYLKPDSTLIVIIRGWRTEAGPQYEGYYFRNKEKVKIIFYEFELF